jgi:CRISPR-associated protein Cmr4
LEFKNKEKNRKSYEMNKKKYDLVNYYTIALDPIHIGSGSERLGRVDLSIIRESGTNLPKIPATSLNGAARYGTAVINNKIECAGRGGSGGEKHCGEINPACPVCVPFGFSKTIGKSRSMKGLAHFFDAHILFYPVNTMVGTLWITSPLALEGVGLNEKFSVPNNCFHTLGNIKTKDALNFGWLLLKKEEGKGEIDKIKNIDKIPPEIKNNSILIPNNLYSIIINNNLEVRTSVNIDPATGTAEDKSLYTYEAIPRGTIFKFDVLYNSGNNFKIGEEELKDDNNQKISSSWIKDKVEFGLKLFSTLGVGGLTSKGFGRLKILNLNSSNGGN